MPTNKATILIVEDEAIIAADLESKLRKVGYATCGITAYGEQVLDLARQHRPDLILMDIRLAGAMDGVEAAEIIRRELDLPVIFLTAYCDRSYLDRAKHVDPFGFLIKPFEELGLESHIQMGLYKHQVEKRLRRANEQLVGILESLSDGFVALDRTWRYTYVNAAAERMFRKKRDELLGRDMRTIFPNASFLHHYEKAMVDHQRSNFEEFSAPLGLWLETRVDPSPDGISIYFRDVSDRRRADEERQSLQVQFLQSQKMESVGRLAGGIAHDFNNMLGVIIGNVDSALFLSPSQEEMKEYLEQIKKAAERSANLTRQLLTFARKQTVNPKVLDLNTTVTGMIRMLTRLIGEDVNLTWEPGSDLWKVRIDPTQVDQILANLVVNSRDAIAGSGNITIRTANALIDAASRVKNPDAIAGEYVRLSITDDGKGIDPAILPHIFEPFFTTKDVGQGTGLGLATVYGIAKQNCGFIEILSHPGEGTTFHLHLPRSIAEEIAPNVSGLRKNLPTGTETILLVEDEPALLESTKMGLSRLGYTILAAQHSTEAIDLAKQHPSEIHLLVTDVVMPEMNGRELADRVVALRPGLKCLFISGYPADVITHRGILDKGVLLLQKPFAMKELATTVRRILDSEGSSGDS